jgi:tetratricopeptide (TPR) repeat protein
MGFSKFLVGFFTFLLILSFPSLKAQTAQELFARGVENAQNMQFESAIGLFSQAITQSPSMSSAFAWRGYCQQKLNQWHKAEEDYNRALLLNKNEYLALDNRGVMYLQSGKYELALTDFEQAIILNPDKAWNFMMRAEAKYQFKKSGNSPRNISFFDINNDFSIALALNSQLGFAYRRRAEANIDSLQINFQLPENQLLIDICNDLNQAHQLGDLIAKNLQTSYCSAENVFFLTEKAFQLGQKMLREGNPKQAFVLFDYIVQQKRSDLPFFAPALAKRAELKNMVRDYSGAIDDFTLLIALQPEKDYLTGLGYYQRGLTYREMGNLAQAITDFQKAIAIGYDFSWIHYELGNTQFALKLNADACDNWTISWQKGNQKAGELLKQNCGQTLTKKKKLFDFLK